MAYIELTNEGIVWVDENEPKCSAELMDQISFISGE